MSRQAQLRWPAARAHAWQERRGWRVGCNFTPSSASNQLELWQKASFDPAAIERELELAAGLGFTSLRVFLHDLAWQQDPGGFLERLDVFLAAAAARGLGVLFVLFDGVWNPRPRPGPQPEPRDRVHNSAWLQSPGAEVLGSPQRQDALRPYVTAVVERFGDDPRVDGWDLFNEPDNPNFAYASDELPDKAERALELLTKTVGWVREIGPSQPLTIGVWRGDWSDEGRLSAIDRFSLDNSDLISFHCYGDLEDLAARVGALRRYERPILCTEFMARTTGSTFDPHLGWMRDQGVGAYCWGLVAGRTQTQYPWDSWIEVYDSEPEPWFHDILRSDGRPFDPSEVAYLRSLTSR